MLISKVQAVYSLKLILQFVRRHALLNVRSLTFESASFLLPDWYYSCKNSTAKFHHRLSTWIMVCFFFWFKKYFCVCVFCVNACFFCTFLQSLVQKFTFCKEEFSVFVYFQFCVDTYTSLNFYGP